jgi:hypothetical protein
MAEFNLTKSLDPRLRRLVRSMNDPERLRSDRERAFVTAAPEAPDTAPEQHSKRVLVQVDRDELPAEFSGLNWHRLADGVYSVNVPVTRLEELAKHVHVKFVESGRRMTAALDTSVPAATVDVVHAPPAGTVSTAAAWSSESSTWASTSRSMTSPGQADPRELHSCGISR